MTVRRVVLATDVEVEPHRAYEFLLDFSGYPEYTDVLEDVRRDGDGGVGTEYHLDVTWWRIDRTLRSRVTALSPPDRIDWRLLADLAIRGAWRIDQPESTTAPTQVRLVVEYDPSGSRLAGRGIGAALSSDRLRRSLVPRVRAEAEALLERIVTDLEGERREVELRVLEWPDAWGEPP